jgi:acetyl esterase/lipase/hemerythrin-like domain-containing protein
MGAAGAGKVITKNRMKARLKQAVQFEDDQYRYTGKAPVPKSADPRGALPDILATLGSEHRYIHSMLDILDGQLDKLRPGKIADYQLLLDVVEYLSYYPDQYHHPREDLLFGSLLRKDMGFRKYVKRLEREHQTIRTYNEQLFQELRSVVSGQRVEQHQLRQSLQRYVSGYREHMEFESREIFPRAHGSLNTSELQDISARTRYIDDPIFGREIQKRFRRLARHTGLRMTDLGVDLVAAELTVFEQAMRRLNQGIKSIDEALLRQRAKASPDGHGGGTSWQARVLNGFTRITMKPLLGFGSIDSARSVMVKLDAQQEALLADDIRAREVVAAGYAGEWVKIAKRRPKRTILYFPGGGFVLRTVTQHKAFVAQICREAGARALIVHYRLAPEVPFPGGLEDCLAAYHDLLAQGVKPEHITIAGDSAGGGLVLSTLLALRDEGTPMPANAIVLSPLADLTNSGESRIINRYRDPVLPARRLSELQRMYIGDASPVDRFLSPVFADFNGLPPILGQVGSTEILLDDARRSAQRATEAGVPFYLEVWRDMPHVFSFFSILPESAIAMARMAKFIRNSELEPLPEEFGWSA